MAPRSRTSCWGSTRAATERRPEPAPLYHFGTLKLKDDKLSGSTSRNFGPTVTDALHITGTFSGEELSGKVTVDQSIKSLGSCTEADTFKAKLK